VKVLTFCSPSEVCQLADEGNKGGFATSKIYSFFRVFLISENKLLFTSLKTSILCYNDGMDIQPTIHELIKEFLLKGGHIDKYYLHNLGKGKHTVLFLNGWFGGKNIREALLKALA